MRNLPSTLKLPRLWLLAGVLATSSCSEATEDAQHTSPSVVKTEQTKSKQWQLLKNGEPYSICGGGGQEKIALFAQLGGNSLRTWGLTHLEETDRHGRDLLDRAHEQGLSVAAGIWVGHPRHGFDYNDNSQVETQRQHVREIVRRYKDRPALLIWGLGNEVEMQQSPENYPQIFGELNALAQIIKEEDPNHPVMTSIVGADPQKIKALMKYYPELDILGINAYGSARHVPKKIKLSGWDGPYVLTEFGPNGPWEREKTSWGVPTEPTPLEKIEMYNSSYEANAASPQCLGSYAFRWGAKQEFTATWFGLLLATGEKTPPVDHLVHGWTGKWPENRSPVITSIKSDFIEKEVRIRSKHTLRIQATDADDDELTLSAWVMEEASETKVGGDAEEIPNRVENCFQATTPETMTFKAPSEKGNYRAFIKASDLKGGACVYSFPFRTE